MLFLNVNPNILQDKNFKEGFTKNRLKKYSIEPEDIIFEITERVTAADNIVFIDSVNHYKNQNYGIAIDDIGSCYSGLNTIVDVKPNFIKIDMNLIRNIDKDEMKISMCKTLVELSLNTGIGLIAEGIETESELKTLIKLGVSYGQGYFLSLPQETFEDIALEKATMIFTYHSKHNIEKINIA